MTRRRFILLGWLFVLGLSAALPLSALFHGIVHVGTGTLTFQQPLDKPLISVGSNVRLDRGSRAIVVVIFGNLRLQGKATDDLVTVGGRTYLTPYSRAEADVLSVLGGIYQAPHVLSSGRLGGAVHPWDGKTVSQHRSVLSLLGGSARLGLAAGLALLLAGTCLTIIFPWQIVLISSTLRGSPVKSAAAGIMILLTFAFLVVPLGLSLAGIPFAILLTASAALAWLFGMTASAVLVGRLIAHGTASLLWAAAAGLVVLALIMAVPILGPVVIVLVGLFGAGALAVALISRARPLAPVS